MAPAFFLFKFVASPIVLPERQSHSLEWIPGTTTLETLIEESGGGVQLLDQLKATAEHNRDGCQVKDKVKIIHEYVSQFLKFVESNKNKQISRKFVLTDPLTRTSYWDLDYLDFFFKCITKCIERRMTDGPSNVNPKHNNYATFVDHIYKNLPTLAQYMQLLRNDQRPNASTLGEMLTGTFNGKDTPLEFQIQQFQNIHQISKAHRLDLSQTWNMIFTHYFKWDGRFQIRRDLFENAPRVEDFISNTNNPALDTAYQSFVDHIVDQGLVSNNRTDYIKFLTAYFDDDTALHNTSENNRYWLIKLNQHLQNQGFQSGDLTKLYAKVLRQGLQNLTTLQSQSSDFLTYMWSSFTDPLSIPTTSSATQQSDVESAIRHFFDDPNPTIPNRQIERHRVEIALVFLNTLGESLIGADQIVKGSLREELDQFLKIIQYTQCMYLLVFNTNPADWHSNPDTNTYLFEANKNNVISELATHLMDPKAYRSWKAAFALRRWDKKPRSEFSGLHYWMLEFSELFGRLPDVQVDPSKADFITTKYALFWSLFDHIQKRGPNAIEHPTLFREAIETSINALNTFYALLNPLGFRVDQSSAEATFMTVIHILSRRIYPNPKKLAEIATEITNQIHCLTAIFHRHLPDGIETISYKGIAEDHLQTIMISGVSDNNDVNEFVDNFATTFQEKIEIICETANVLLPLLKEGASANQAYIDSLKNNPHAFEALKSELQSGESTIGATPLTEEQALILFFKNQLKGPGLSHIQKGDKPAFLNHLFNLDSKIQRKLSRYNFSLQALHDAYNKLNHKDHHIQRYDALMQFDTNLTNEFNAIFQSGHILPDYMEFFQFNQSLALFKINRMLGSNNPTPLFLKIGTGQGKTLIESMSVFLAFKALNFLKQEAQSNPTQKAIILTTFPHLAQRDSAAMTRLFEHYGVDCLCLNTLNACGALTDDRPQVIYADSATFVCQVVEAAASPQIESHKKLLAFAYSDWNNHLVILDEADVILDKKEPFNYYPVIDQFRSDILQKSEGFFKSQTEASEQDRLSEKAKKFFTSGAYSDINQLLGKKKKEIEALFDNNNPGGKIHTDQSGDKTRTAGGLGAQLNKKPAELHLFTAVFSLKQKLNTCRRLIGFSGTLSQSRIDDYQTQIFNNKRLNFIKIPLFFSPDSEFSQAVTCRAMYASAEQLPWLTESSRKNFGKMFESVRMQNSLERSAWLAAIEIDIEAGLLNRQPVVIFAYDDDTETSDFKEIKKHLHTKHGNKITVLETDEQAHPSTLQKIAKEGQIALCNKKVGRGADIRVDPIIENGLHIVIASPDYEAEMLQQMGRTGRMNRRGSFSFIFRDSATIPQYQDEYSGWAAFKEDAMAFSSYFYAHRWAQIAEENKAIAHQKFMWLLFAYYHSGSALKAGKKEDVLRYLLDSL